MKCPRRFLSLPQSAQWSLISCITWESRWISWLMNSGFSHSPLDLSTSVFPELILFCRSIWEDFRLSIRCSLTIWAFARRRSVLRCILGYDTMFLMNSHRCSTLTLGSCHHCNQLAWLLSALTRRYRATGKERTLIFAYFRRSYR